MKKKSKHTEYPGIRAELDANHAITAIRCVYVSGLTELLPNTLCQIYVNNDDFRISPLPEQKKTIILNMSEIVDINQYKEVIPSFPISTTHIFFAIKYKDKNIIFRPNSVSLKDAYYNGKVFRSQNFYTFMKSYR